MQDRETVIDFGLKSMAAGASPESVLRLVFTAGEYQGVMKIAGVMEKTVESFQQTEATDGPPTDGL